MASLKTRWILAILPICGFFLFGCANLHDNNDNGGRRSVSVALSVTLPNSQSARLYKALGTVDDIVAVRVEVRRSSDNSTVVEETDLTETTSGSGNWEINLENLPEGVSLDFIGNAYNSDDQAIFSGTVTQELTADTVNAIILGLSSIDDGTQPTLPKIVAVTLAAEIGINSTNNMIIFTIEHTDRVNFTISAEYGTITSDLSGTHDAGTGSLTVTYDAPSSPVQDTIRLIVSDPVNQYSVAAEYPVVVTESSTPNEAGFLTLKGSINKTEDYAENARYFGEVLNTGTSTVCFIKVSITSYSSTDALLDTSYSYLYGMPYLSDFGASYDHSLGPNEFGSFQVITDAKHSDVSRYVYNIEYRTFDVYSPTLSLTIDGNIAESINYFGGRTYLGQVINNGNDTAVFVKIRFTMKNINDLVIGSHLTYINGNNCTLPSGIETDTCLAPMEVGSFEAYTLTPATDVSSYYYRIYHSEYDVSSNQIYREKRSNLLGLGHDYELMLRNKEIDKQLENHMTR
jgi:hypothetical protein